MDVQSRGAVAPATAGSTRTLVRLMAMVVGAIGGAIVATGVGFGVTAAAAQADGQVAAETAQQTIMVRHSGRCVGVQSGSTSAGAPVTQQTCADQPHQAWTSVPTDGGYVRLQAAHSGLCLAIEGASSANLARAVQQPCGSGAEQQFLLRTASGRWQSITARHSGKCLDVEGGSTAAGAALIQWPCHGGNNQQFSFDLTAGTSGAVGRWGPVIGTPVIPVAAAGLPNGKVLLWSAFAPTTFGGNRGYTQTAIFDPNTGTSAARQVSNTGHDMFCPGIANLADGRVLVNGGSNAAETSIYNPATDSWEDAQDMTIPRGYQGTTLLSDGSAFTLGGSWSGGQGGKTAEVWTPATGWQRRNGIPADPFVGNDPQGIYRGDNHLWLFGWKDNTVFHAGPSRNMHWIETAANGSWSRVGPRGSDGYAMNGNAVMYEPGKILTVGGATAYNNGRATANATVIDITGETVTSRPVASMNRPRTLHASTVLPSGEVVVTGGQGISALFRDDESVLTAELWDPETETFRELAPMSVPRNYHSVGLLLADGRVLVGGGGLCGGCGFDHQDVQIFSPPYLLNDDGTAAQRPRIITAPQTLDLNHRFEVTTNAPVSEFALVRVSSATHALNNDQRRIPLTATPGDANLTYDLRTPSEGGIAIPGAYYLFAMDDAGVPSVAATVTITTDRRPDVEPTIGDQVSFRNGTPAAGVQVDLFTRAADGSRGAFVDSMTTDADGRYRFEVSPGCYVLTFVAPEGETFGGSRWYQPEACVEPGEQRTDIDAVLDGVPSGSPAIGGAARFTDGRPAADVQVDLFAAAPDGSRGEFIGARRTSADGTYRFDVAPGCYVLTFVAPDGTTFDGSRWFQPQACVEPGEERTDVDAVLTGQADLTWVSGSITEVGGDPVAGVAVDLFETNGDGSRGRFLASTTAGADGSYRFDVAAGCYTLTFIAPDGRTFNGSRWLQPSLCLDPAEPVEDLDAVLDPVA